MNDAERYAKAKEQIDKAKERYYSMGLIRRRDATLLPWIFIFFGVSGFFWTGEWRLLVMVLPPVGLYVCVRVEKELFTRRANGERDDLYHRKTFACYGGMVLCCLAYVALGELIGRIQL